LFRATYDAVWENRNLTFACPTKSRQSLEDGNEIFTPQVGIRDYFFQISLRLLSRAGHTRAALQRLMFAAVMRAS
jgi:hypothetical protein